MNHQDKPVCSSNNSAPKIKDADGFSIFNSLYRHPDAVVNVSYDECYFRGNDIVIVTRPYVVSAGFFCPHCSAGCGYLRGLNKSLCIPSTFWKLGELDNYDRIDAGDITV